MIKYMYVDEGSIKDKIKVPWSMTAAVAICVIATIVLGVWPDPVIDICEQAARTLFAG